MLITRWRAASWAFLRPVCSIPHPRIGEIAFSVVPSEQDRLPMGGIIGAAAPLPACSPVKALVAWATASREGMVVNALTMPSSVVVMLGPSALLT